jgi:hypothetical protein
MQNEKHPNKMFLVMRFQGFSNCLKSLNRGISIYPAFHGPNPWSPSLAAMGSSKKMS